MEETLLPSRGWWNLWRHSCERIPFPFICSFLISPAPAPQQSSQAAVLIPPAFLLPPITAPSSEKICCCPGPSSLLCRRNWLLLPAGFSLLLSLLSITEEALCHLLLCNGAARVCLFTSPMKSKHPWGATEAQANPREVCMKDVMTSQWWLLKSLGSCCPILEILNSTTTFSGFGRAPSHKATGIPQISCRRCGERNSRLFTAKRKQE